MRSIPRQPVSFFGAVNIVRSPDQADILKRHVCDSSKEDFVTVLTDAVAETGATITFDAIVGIRLVNKIFCALRAGAVRQISAYSGYGSNVHRQIYIHGALDNALTALIRSSSLAWSVG